MFQFVDDAVRAVEPHGIPAEHTDVPAIVAVGAVIRAAPGRHEIEDWYMIRVAYETLLELFSCHLEESSVQQELIVQIVVIVGKAVQIGKGRQDVVHQRRPVHLKAHVGCVQIIDTCLHFVDEIDDYLITLRKTDGIGVAKAEFRH